MDEQIALASASDDYRRLCQTHPQVNYKKEWGCPECVRVLRKQKLIREEALREIKAVHTHWYRGDMTGDEAVRQMEHIAVGVWVREDSPNKERPETPAFSLRDCGGLRGWRYRLIHWICSRWGYFPIPWDSVEAAGWLPSTAAFQDSWNQETIGRALAMAEVSRELILWRAGISPNDPDQRPGRQPKS